MSNYPAGTMRGSGIYTTETTMQVQCGVDLNALGILDEVAYCAFSGEVDVTINDGGFLGYWTCPQCDFSHEMELDDGPDPDDAYDRMREERDGFFD